MIVIFFSTLDDIYKINWELNLMFLLKKNIEFLTNRYFVTTLNNTSCKLNYK